MLNRIAGVSVLMAAVALCAIGIAESKSEKKADAPEPGSDIKLERVPGMTPEQSMASTEVNKDFRMDLVASEPLVMSPVAMAFDEAARMYVVEMRDYSEKDKERLGRVQLLSDEDGDGKYETSKIFVEDLSWPTAIACYDGGVFIGNPPEIIYCKDTDGDGKADVRKVVYTGFGRTNVQGLLNTFLWGLDDKIYGQTSSSGGKIVRPGVNAPPIDLHGRDFRFDPKTLEIEAITGGGQHGMSFNRWGDRFVCQNSDHLQAIVFEERYVARNPYQSVVSARRSIASDGPQAPVYRISPVEGWREARTKLRVAGLVPGPVEGGGRAAGYFTGSTGVTIYEGGLWSGKDEIALISDVGSNLIHRKKLSSEGVTYRGDRIDENTEFVRSKDIWFRPVQMTVGPEGGLYVMDMYREVIEHPSSLPAVLKRQLDLSSGQDQGRLYRIVPDGYQYSRPKSLAGASTVELAAALDDPNQWRRTTALRLIYEQQKPDAGKVLHAQLAKTKRPESVIAILYALDSVNALADDDLITALRSQSVQVRRHAIRLSEPRLDKSAALRDQLFVSGQCPAPAVQFQFALSLGECHDPKATDVLASILASANDRDIRDAALTSIVDRAGAVLGDLLSIKGWTTHPNAEPVLGAIVGQIVRQRHAVDLDVLISLLKDSGGKDREAGTAALLKALSHLPSDALAGSDPPQLVKLRELRQSAAKTIVAEAEKTLANGDATPEQRVEAIEDLTLDAFDSQRERLETLLMPQEPAAIHEAVLRACSQYDSPKVAELVLSRWAQFSPGEKSQATELLLRRGQWAFSLAQYLEKQNLRITTLDPAQATKLENYPSPKVRDIARKLRGQGAPADRQQVFNDYREVLAAQGDAAEGKQIFQKNCAVCHEMGGVGNAVGPNLAAMINRGAESVLFNVLAPNVEVDPRFLEYVVLTNDGQVISGVVAGETSTAVTLRGPENKTTTVLRVDIDEMHNTGKSLMPEGFEKLIDKKSMGNLLAFLKQAAAQSNVAGEKK